MISAPIAICFVFRTISTDPIRNYGYSGVIWNQHPDEFRGFWLGINVWGAADLLFAFYQGFRVELDASMFGAAFFIPTAVVPPLLIMHRLTFWLLVRPASKAQHRTVPRPCAPLDVRWAPLEVAQCLKCSSFWP
jgi:hypothetical protein